MTQFVWLPKALPEYGDPTAAHFWGPRLTKVLLELWRPDDGMWV